MKAIQVRQFGNPEVLQLLDLPSLTPQPGEVLIRVHAVGVNPVETYIRSGRYSYRPALPYTPGSDAAGVVEEVCEGVTTLGVGDRVFTFGPIGGAYAEQMVAPAEYVRPLPTRISFSQGAALGIPYITAWRALLLRGAGKPGEKVLVHGGSGGVGLAVIQIAKAHGLEVFATAGSVEGRALVAKHGAAHVFDHHQPNYLEKIQLAAGDGLNLIVEMLANVNLDKDLGLLAKFGRVVIVGSRGPVEINPRALMMRDADIRGLISGNLSGVERAELLAGLSAGLENGSLDPVVSRELPLAEAAQAHHLLLEGKAQGKIVLIP